MQNQYGPGSFYVFCLVLFLSSGPALAQTEDGGLGDDDTHTADAGIEVAKEEVTTEPVKEDKAPIWTDYIRIKGDFRYRFEMIDKDEKDLRYRHRIRARLGVHAKIIDDLGVVVQLGTGGSDDPVSNNQSLTEAFSSKPLWLDLAYFDWHPSFADGLKLVGGKMKNPFYRVGKTELQWDPDMNPEGLALSYNRAFGLVEPFVHGGGFWMEERKEDDDSWLLGAQGGLKFTFADGLFYVLAGGGYMDFTAIRGHGLYWDPEDSFGNSTIEDEEGNLTYAGDFNEVNAFGEIGGKIVHLPWAVFADWATNIGADDDNTGWLIGASLGKCKESLDFQVRYIYREVEKDAVVALLTDSDFKGGGTDGKGHEANLSFQIVKGIKLAATYFYNQTPLEDTGDYHRAQFDLKFKF
ncbi:MAG: hypothetical protein GY854_17265 [Deltaproteobacteria bacterium]|nr:hypothetical protein [Deltaproteobacteria bacterium]